MSFSDYDVTRRTRKGNFLKQIDQLIDWSAIERAIAVHYAPVLDAAGRPAYSGLLLFKMLLVGIWHGGLSDESVEDTANSNLHVMRFLGLSLEDDVPDHSVLSRFRTRLTAADAWDELLDEVNRQIHMHGDLCKIAQTFWERNFRLICKLPGIFWSIIFTRTRHNSSQPAISG